MLTENPTWLRGVEYDAASRCHRVDGRPAPSVTQVISAAHPDRFARIPRAVLARKAAIGTAVHQAAQAYAEQLEAASFAQEVEPRFAAWKWFCQTRRVKPLLCEAVVCSRDLGLPASRRRPYVGRLDFLCVVDGKQWVLLDLKTGDPSLAGLQTLAYLDALYQQYPDLIALDIHRWAVVVHPDETYRIHTYRDDAGDAYAFRNALERCYAEETPVSFDLPDDGPALDFDLPDEPAQAELVMLPTTRPLIRELSISPDVEAYLTMLEDAVAPFESAAKAFSEQMAIAPVETPQQLAELGQQSLYAKEREKLIEGLFEPAIKKPRLYLDRVYAVKRRVIQWWQEGGSTAATRYLLRKRELEDADRRARIEAERKQREAQQAADQEWEKAHRRLTDEAFEAARQGEMTAARDLVAQARELQPALVPVEPVPESQADAAAVPGLGEREGWTATITDMLAAIQAAARPAIYREVAAAIDEGELTAGGQSMTTKLISHKLRELASELPVIPSSLFQGNAAELKKRAQADRDTLRGWQGFLFERISTPVRRMVRK